jgi:hypothetical protein
VSRGLRIRHVFSVVRKLERPHNTYLGTTNDVRLDDGGGTWPSSLGTTLRGGGLSVRVVSNAVRSSAVGCTNDMVMVVYVLQAAAAGKKCLNAGTRECTTHTKPVPLLNHRMRIYQFGDLLWMGGFAEDGFVLIRRYVLCSGEVLVQVLGGNPIGKLLAPAARISECPA